MDANVLAKWMFLQPNHSNWFPRLHPSKEKIPPLIVAKVASVANTYMQGTMMGER